MPCGKRSVTELNVLWKEKDILEALTYDPDVPCSLQCGLLWSSPSRLSQRFSNDGTNIAKYHDAGNMSIEITFTMPFEGLHTPACLLRSVGVVLYRSPDRDWNDDEEMKGWGVGEFPCLLPFGSVSDDDLSDV